MKTPENFEFKEEYCHYRLSGHGSLAEAASKVMDAVNFARQQGIQKLLIDTTQWTGHGSPSTLDRYHLASAFTEASGRTVKMSMVVRPELMDPEKFEVVVATNRGLSGNVFDSEKAALDWLLGPTMR